MTTLKNARSMARDFERRNQKQISGRAEHMKVVKDTFFWPETKAKVKTFFGWRGGQLLNVIIFLGPKCLHSLNELKIGGMPWFMCLTLVTAMARKVFWARIANVKRKISLGESFLGLAF